MDRPQPDAGRDWVALILAIGLATAVNVITLALLWDAVHHEEQISENGTQILVAAFGGMVGVLGGYVGGRSAERAATRRQQQHDARQPHPGNEDDPP